MKFEQGDLVEFDRELTFNFEIKESSFKYLYFDLGIVLEQESNKVDIDVYTTIYWQNCQDTHRFFTRRFKHYEKQKETSQVS